MKRKASVVFAELSFDALPITESWDLFEESKRQMPDLVDFCGRTVLPHVLLVEDVSSA